MTRPLLEILRNRKFRNISAELLFSHLALLLISRLVCRKWRKDPQEIFRASRGPERASKTTTIQWVAELRVEPINARRINLNIDSTQPREPPERH